MGHSRLMMRAVQEIWARRPKGVAGTITLCLLWLGLVWLVVLFKHQILEILHKTAGRDFLDYYYSTRAFRRGASIYDQRAMEELARKQQGFDWIPPYMYPPYITVLFLPISNLGYMAARILWLIFNYGFLFLSFEAMRRLCLLIDKPSQEAATWLAWLTPVAAIWSAIAFQPVRDHNWQGQSNLLVLCLITWGIYLEWKRPYRFPIGAVLLAAGGLFKLFPLFILPGYIAMRRFRTIVAMAGAGIVITAVTLVFIPPSEFLRLPSALNQSMYVSTSQEQIPGDYSAAAALRWLAAPTIVPAIGIMLVRGLPSATHFLAFAWQGNKRSELATILRLSQAFVLLGFIMFRWWDHHMVMFLFPLFIGSYACLRLPRRGAKAAALGLLVLSCAYIGAIAHPALLPLPHFEDFQRGKVVAELLLITAIEILIWTTPMRLRSIGT